MKEKIKRDVKNIRKKELKSQVIKETEASGEKESKEQSRKYESQFKWVIFGMVALILVIVGVYFIALESKKVSYGGLIYEKIAYSQTVSLYHTQIPVKDVNGNLIANFNLYLRNDPRELKEIAISDPIQLKVGTIVSLDKDAEISCSDAGIAGANFFGFLKTAGVKVSVAYAQEDYAKERNASYVNCETNTSQSVIVIRKGKENRIIQERKDCFVLEFKDCEILKITERFMVALYANSKGIKV